MHPLGGGKARLSSVECPGALGFVVRWVLVLRLFGLCEILVFLAVSFGFFCLLGTSCVYLEEERQDSLSSFECLGALGFVVWRIFLGCVGYGCSLLSCLVSFAC